MKINARRINYFGRLKKESLWGFLVIIAIILYVYIRSNEWNTTILLISSAIVMIGIFSGIAIHFAVRKYYYEIEIRDGEIVMKGDDINSPIEIKFPIEQTKISIKSQGKGRGNIEYYLRFTHEDKVVDVNRICNWDYSDLINLVHEFKNVKNERVTWTEKSILDYMDKKAEGMSSFQIAFGKKKKTTPQQ